MIAPHEVVVVVPTYNERQNLEGLVKGVRSHGYHVIVVDDASPDGTGDLADSLAASDPAFSVIHRAAKAGLGPAYASAFEVAVESYRVICQIDCDRSHDPTDLPRLIQAVDDGSDLVIGSRYVEGGATPDWPIARRLISRSGNWYARTLLGMHTRDATAGFRAFKSEALVRLDARSCEATGYGFQVEMAWRAEQQRLVVEEIPIIFRDRRYGTSKMNGRIVAEAMWLVTKWGLGRLTGRAGSRGVEKK